MSYEGELLQRQGVEVRPAPTGPSHSGTPEQRPPVDTASWSDDLSESASAEPPKKRGTRLRSAISTILKIWGVHAFCTAYLLLFGHPRPSAHVIVYKKHIMTAFAAVIHLAPAAVAITIGSFIYQERWVGADITPYGKYDSVVTFAYLVAAKVFEIVIIASMAAMLFAFVRWNVLRGEGAPLAAFVAGEAFRSPTFLWSDEYFAILLGRFSSIWYRVAFSLFAMVYCVVALVVAPATATIILPVQDWYPIAGCKVWMGIQSDRIFPTSIRATDAHLDEANGHCLTADNSPCPATGWEVLRSALPWMEVVLLDQGLDMMNEEFAMPGLRGYSQLDYVKSRRGWFARMPTAYVGQVVLGTVRLMDLSITASAVEDGISRRGSQNRASLTTSSAAVMTRCWHNDVDDVDLFAGPLRVPDLNSPDEGYADFWPTPSFREFVSAAADSPVSEILFFNLPGNMTRKASIGSVAAVVLDGEPVYLTICLSNARWMQGRHRISSIGGVLRVDVDTADLAASMAHPGFVENGTVRYNTEYADMTNPVVLDSSQNSTVFEQLAAAATSSEYTAKAGAPLQHLVEFITSSMLTNGMARLHARAKLPTANFRNNGHGMFRNFFPARGKSPFEIDPEQSIFEPPDDAENTASFSLLMEMYGWAYTKRDNAARFALIGLFVYSGIALLFVLWNLFYGTTSAAWQSTAEIMALAMRSPPPGDEKMPTSLLEDPKALRQRYCVVADGQEVFLVPVDGVVPPGSRIQPGVMYR